jgi:AcrR family transcriptional regulator
MGVCQLARGLNSDEREEEPVPTGVAMRDARRQLFDAAERVVARDGAQALTSRAVTTEARCAKGVLHRHFSDFDAFLSELVLDRVARVEKQAMKLQAAAGTETVETHVAQALAETFTPVAIEIVGLITSRNSLRQRLRQTSRAGVPILTEAATMIASYLALEREFGRIPIDADVEGLAIMLIGTGHMLFAGQVGAPPDPGSVEKVVVTVLAGATNRAGVPTDRGDG